MRAYSQSQGTFVDVPDQTGGGSMTTGVPEGYNPMGDQFSKLRSGLLMGALADPSNASKYGSILNIAKPTAYETGKQQEVGELKNITGPLEVLKKQTSSGIRGYTDYVSFKTQENLVSQTLAKLIERNRLSDADRTFYRSNFPNVLEVMFAPKAAKAKLDTVEKYLKVRMGENTVNSVSQEEKTSAPSSFVPD